MSLFTRPSFAIRLGAARGADASAARTPARTLSLLLLFACAGLVSCGASSPAAAEEAAAIWQAGDVSGDVQVRAAGAGDWHALKAGDTLGRAAEVRTGSDGHAVLTHRTTTITVAPQSQFALPKAEGGSYRILQMLGTVIYKVKERVASMAKFEVETPYLTAVVKGTAFSVSSGPQGGAVDVTEGVVGVQSLTTGESATLTIGQTARMASAAGAKLTIEGNKAGADQPKAGSEGTKGKESGAKDNKQSGAKEGSADRGNATGGSAAGTDTRGQGPALPEASDARAVVIHEDGSDHQGAAVTVTKLDGAPGTAESRHPNAVAIFVAGSGDGIFAPGTNVQTAFKEASDDSSGARGQSGSSDGAGIGKAVSSLASKPSDSETESDEEDLADDDSKSGSNSGSSGGSTVAALSTGGGDISSSGNSGSGSLNSNAGGNSGGLGSGSDSGSGSLNSNAGGNGNGLGGGNGGGSLGGELASAATSGTLGAATSGTLGTALGTLTGSSGGTLGEDSDELSKAKGKSEGKGKEDD
jgi:hypothetical protein